MKRYIDAEHFNRRLMDWAISNTVDLSEVRIPFREVEYILETEPTAEQTLYGYPVEHLMLIAEVMRKENVTPEKVMEVLTDAGRIASMVRDEFEEQLRKAVERCWTN